MGLNDVLIGQTYISLVNVSSSAGNCERHKQNIRSQSMITILKVARDNIIYCKQYISLVNYQRFPSINTPACSVIKFHFIFSSYANLVN